MKYALLGKAGSYVSLCEAGKKKIKSIAIYFRGFKIEDDIRLTCSRFPR